MIFLIFFLKLVKHLDYSNHFNQPLTLVARLAPVSLFHLSDPVYVEKRDENGLKTAPHATVT